MFGKKRIAGLEKELDSWENQYRILLATYEVLKSDFKFVKRRYEREIINNMELKKKNKELRDVKDCLELIRKDLVKTNYIQRKKIATLNCLLEQATKRADDLDDKLYEIKKVVGVNNG